MTARLVVKGASEDGADRMAWPICHLAVWDLAFFGRQDRVSHLSTEIPLTHERIEWWQNRLKSVIQRVNETWPGVPIWLRKLHRVGPVGGASCKQPLRARAQPLEPHSTTNHLACH